MSAPITTSLPASSWWMLSRFVDIIEQTVPGLRILSCVSFTRNVSLDFMSGAVPTKSKLRIRHSPRIPTVMPL